MFTNMQSLAGVAKGAAKQREIERTLYYTALG